MLFAIEAVSLLKKDKNSSYVKDKCYALFATNRDCIDKCEESYKLDTSRLQMIMVDYT